METTAGNEPALYTFHFDFLKKRESFMENWSTDF